MKMYTQKTAVNHLNVQKHERNYVDILNQIGKISRLVAQGCLSDTKCFKAHELFNKTKHAHGQTKELVGLLGVISRIQISSNN